MCGAPVNPLVILDFLNSNPGMHVNAVIYANTLKERQKGIRRASIALKTIPKNRIRYFYSKSPGYTGSAVEYWLVPKKH